MTSGGERNRDEYGVVESVKDGVCCGNGVDAQYVCSCTLPFREWMNAKQYKRGLPSLSIRQGDLVFHTKSQEIL